MNGCLGGENVTAEKVTSLRKTLLRDYDPYLRPRRRQLDTVVINATFTVKRFHDLNEKEEKVSLLGYLQFQWNDEFLVWKREDYSNISDIVVKTNDIWWPTVSLGNPIGNFENIRNHYGIFHVSSSGEINWSAGGLFSVACDLNLEKYPFDTHTCDFVFVVLGYSSDDVIIKVNPNVQEIKGTTEWDVVNASMFGISGEKSGLIVRFVLQRKSFFVVLTVLLPLSLLSMLNLCVFLIPVESGEKTSFAITTFLAYSIYLSALGSSLSAKDNIYLTMYIEILMITGVIIVLFVIGQTRLFFYYGDHLLPCCRGKTVHGENTDVKKTTTRKLSRDNVKQARTWASSMGILDQVLFFLFLCILGIITVYHFWMMMF
ncbi:acetylcholine receptor subunit beta-like [Saccostrea echinata]|uniref:acetylcholine receptor subunit beta-like n=1 Tax=Saccostrea echinata TaxID=191078 RepID=UPI002A7EF2BD|nr:acetylcholine receptor subunit beta-like [Saccostrea echinata]